MNVFNINWILAFVLRTGNRDASLGYLTLQVLLKALWMEDMVTILKWCDIIIHKHIKAYITYYTLLFFKFPLLSQLKIPFILLLKPLDKLNRTLLLLHSPTLSYIFLQFNFGEKLFRKEIFLGLRQLWCYWFLSD